jgi:MFS superfamily sulfate permease-like transporter
VLADSGEPSRSLLEEAPSGAVTAPGVIVVRLAAPLFFANAAVFADAVKRAVNAAPEASVDHLVIDMEAVTDVDVTGAESFETLQTWLDARGIALGFSRVRPDARVRLIELGLLGDHAVYDTNRAAIAALAAHPD